MKCKPESHSLVPKTLYEENALNATRTDKTIQYNESKK